MKHTWLSIISLILLTTVIACQPADEPLQQNDFAVLAQPADGFLQAQAGNPLVFPADHGAHFDHRIEWWYLTANLLSESGEPYGMQWTLFRFAMTPPDERQKMTGAHGQQLFMAHVAVTTPTGHFSFQRYARGSDTDEPARAGVTAQPFSAWLDDWALESTGDDWLPMQVRAKQDDVGFDLHLQSQQALVLQGIEGYSQKHKDGGGSYYYSQPFLEASGELSIDGQKITVSGDAWLDREWGSQFLQQDQSGWDWFSLHLDSGEKLMLFQLRNRGDNPAGNYLHGVLIDPNGAKTPLNPAMVGLEVLDTSPVSGRILPMKWRIELPQIERQFIVQALHENQWMQVDFPYWEGVVTVKGDGPENSGRGYIELTGYSTATAASR